MTKSCGTSGAWKVREEGAMHATTQQSTRGPQERGLRNEFRACFFLLFVGLLPLLGCGEVETWPASAGPERPIVVALLKSGGRGAEEVARDARPLLEALARTTGFEIKPVAVGGPRQAMELLASGEADLTWLGPAFAASALEEGAVHLLAVAATDAAPRGTEAVTLLLMDQDPAQHLHDLNGARIAVALSPGAADPFALLGDEAGAAWIETVHLEGVSQDTLALTAVAEGTARAALVRSATHARTVQDRLFTTTRFRRLLEVEVPVTDCLVMGAAMPASLQRRLEFAREGLELPEDRGDQVFRDSAGTPLIGLLHDKEQVAAIEAGLLRRKRGGEVRAQALATPADGR